MGGSRSDSRLRSVSEALRAREVACLRFDYGPWDEGRGEQRDAACAIDWAVERYESVGLFGYSFGASVALAVAGDRADLAVVAALAPAAVFPDGTETAPSLDRISVPTLVLVGERDDTVDWEPVVAAARAAGHTVESMAADHHFVGQGDAVGEQVGAFLAAHL